MGSTTAVAKMRKLQDGGGAYVWQPSLILGQPDRVLGYPVWENPHMDALASAKKVLVAGDLRSYIVRQVGGIRLDRSDEYAFGNGLVTFRATWRGDGGLPQSSHVKYLLTT
jgi:HK97 family phage major capsid protein